MHNYRQLEVWQIGMKLTKDVYQFSDKSTSSSEVHFYKSNTKEFCINPIKYC